MTGVNHLCLCTSCTHRLENSKYKITTQCLLRLGQILTTAIRVNISRDINILEYVLPPLTDEHVYLCILEYNHMPGINIFFGIDDHAKIIVQEIKDKGSISQWQFLVGYIPFIKWKPRLSLCCETLQTLKTPCPFL